MISNKKSSFVQVILYCREHSSVKDSLCRWIKRLLK